MTNWELEINNHINQENQTNNFNRTKQETADMDIYNQKTGEMLSNIKLNYESIILPGFEILDKFEIKENLYEIKDQIWKIGYVTKRPFDFNEYYKRNEYFIPKNACHQRPITTANHQYGYDNNYDNNLPLIGESKHWDYSKGNSIISKYILQTKTIDYIPYEKGEGGEYGNCGTNEEIITRIKTLVVATDCKNIYVYAGSDDNKKNTQTVIPIKGNDRETKDQIHQALLKDCANRRDYSKLDPIITSKPELIIEYLKYKDSNNIPEGFEYLVEKYGQKNKSKRSFLD